MVSNLLQAFGEGFTLAVIFLAVGLLSESAQSSINWNTKPILSSFPAITNQLAALPTHVIFILLIGIAVVIQAMVSLNAYIGSIAAGRFSARINTQIRALIHSQILKFSFPFASRYKVGDLIYYSSSGPSAVSTQIDVVKSMILHILMITAYLLVLITLSPWLLLVAFILAGVITLIQKNILPKIRKGAYILKDLVVGLRMRITEDLQGLRLLHTSGELDAAAQGIRDRMVSLESTLRKQNRLNALIGPITSFLPVAAIATIAVLSLMVFGTRSSGVLPSLVTFVVSLQRLNQRFSGIASNFTKLSNNAANLDRLNDILNPQDKEFRRIGGIPFEGLIHKIEFVNVSLQYSPELEPALRGINLNILKGQTVALVGSSGSGKSSMADLLVGLYDPSDGEILIDGQQLATIDLPTWQNRLGVVSQDTFLFNTTIAENIAFGTPGATRELIERAASNAQAADFIASLPLGYDTVVGERGYRLSGGQRQRISLARAIISNPDLLILDEATSALDSHSERLVQQAIDRFERRHTVLVIAHRLSTIVNADLICVLDSGRIIERGSHAELLERNGIYTSLWQQQDGASQSTELAKVS